MQVKKSGYLEKIRPAAKKLVQLLCDKYDYCSLLGVDSDSNSYQVSARGVNISPRALYNKRGFVIRVFDKSGQAEYSFNELTEELARRSAWMSTAPPTYRLATMWYLSRLLSAA